MQPVSGERPTELQKQFRGEVRTQEQSNSRKESVLKKLADNKEAVKATAHSDAAAKTQDKEKGMNR